MAYQHQLTRNAGHPFTREAGWDMLEVQAESEAELTAYITAAAKKFWKVWIRDNTGVRRAALYKPSNAAVDWNDEPGSTGLSKLLAGVDMRANQFHIDLVLATFAHQMRTAASLTDLVGRWNVTLGAYGSSGKAVADVTAGLVGAVPALNECLRDVAAPPESDLWREHAQQALTTAEFAMSIEAPEPRQNTRRRPHRRP